MKMFNIKPALLVALIMSAANSHSEGTTYYEFDAIENSRSPVSEKKPDRLKRLYSITDDVDYDPENSGVGEVRLKSIKVAAFSWGVQEGMFWRYEGINKLLDDNATYLHTVFNFNKFIYEGKMLLPTVQKAERIIHQISDKTARTYDVSIELDRPAKLVPMVPTWREYLVRQIDPPQKPHEAMFPRNSIEERAWLDALNKGWEEGVKQANDIYDLDVTLLHKEMSGLYIFRKLLAMNYFKMPKISESKYGNILLADGKVMNLNDTVYTITVESSFENIEDWEPFFRVANDRAELH